ncbi:nitrilase-related carbon-nitrogen hydrolase [Nocardioides sp.]|uniref:nitrilase-related carbon-nitrogen hydrolase n=1 Tax=Nocardioides sp. TaxID=35761 RepID=UPI0027359DC5|nr:nitrilase-related carbon-nitrogen hydrolase [Nocardioides sp.]MDP3889933.1 nitrilase-related carbon-nitrogen hydrolase [Nocardioides sp.]
MSVTVAACQIAADVTRAPSVEGIRHAVRGAAARGARFVVLPELAASGYCFESRAEAAAAAETLGGPTVTTLRQLSEELGLVIVCGWAERGHDDLHNSAVVVERGVVLGTYRKVHLWGREREFFRPAAQPPLVVDTEVGRVAVMVCYDLEFPEWVRRAAQAGAEILAAPVNWPRGEALGIDPAIEVVKAQAAAATYGVHVVVADRCGRERGVDWVGGSLICSSAGRILAGPATGAGEPAMPRTLVATIDPAEAHDKRLGPHNHCLRDRRPELYGEPWGHRRDDQ